MKLPYLGAVAACTLLLLGCKGMDSEEDVASTTPQPSVTDWVPREASLAHNPQGVQNRLASRSAPATTCDDAGIIFYLGDIYACYVDSNDKLYCSGYVHGGYLDGFTYMGISEVEQIIGSSTSSTSGCSGSACNNLCVRKSNGTVWCYGVSSNPIPFNNGGTDPGTTWRQWGSQSNIVEFVSFQNAASCAITADGSATCLGDFSTGYISVPTIMGSLTVATVAIDNAGTLSINDPNIYRVPSSPECLITANGLDCSMWSMAFTAPAGIATGESAGQVNFAPSFCWLDGYGVVHCYENLNDPNTDPTTGVGYLYTDYFANEQVLSLAANSYRTSNSYTNLPPLRCAVYRDGSTWCVGDNSDGSLGTNLPTPLTTETEVLPAGSVRNRCN